MISDNQQVIFCPEDNEYRVYCDICDELCIERYYKNHFQSRTRNNNIHKMFF